MILFIKHIDIEGPGTMGDFFISKGFSIQILDLGAGEALPVTLDGIQAVVSLGGPMNVYEEDKYAFLHAENIFIQKVLKAKIPFMGICLGSQLLAKACGSRVQKSPQKEIGFGNISLTSDGKKDSLFQNCLNQLEVYQWHEDMSIVPPSGVLLASSDECPTQAFRVGENAYGLQFHVEVTDVSIREWSEEYFKDDAAGLKQKNQMLETYQKQRQEFHKTAYQIYENFLKTIPCVSR